MQAPNTHVLREEPIHNLLYWYIIPESLGITFTENLM